MAALMSSAAIKSSPLLRPDQAAAALPGPGEHCDWVGLHGLAIARAVATVASEVSSLVVLVTSNSARAQALDSEIAFFAPDLPRLHFPDWETLPYDGFSPLEDIVSDRLKVLHELPTTTAGVLVLPVQTLLQRVPPTHFVASQTFDLAVGERFDVAAERDALSAAGYQAVDTVTQHGQFAVRGSLMDIFVAGMASPVRIDLFDDEIDTLRLFDPETQLTTDNIQSLQLLPAKEFAFNADAIQRFRNNWHTRFDVDVRRCPIYQDVSSGIPPAGVEYYLPFFHDRLDTLFDYLSSSALLVQTAGVDDAVQHFATDLHERYENLRHDVERPILPPGEMYLTESEWQNRRAAHRWIRLQEQAEHKHTRTFEHPELPDVAFRARGEHRAARLQAFLGSQSTPVAFTAETAGRREMLAGHLAKAGIRPVEVASLAEALSAGAPTALLTAPIMSSAAFADYAVIAESQLLGAPPASSGRETRQARWLDADQIVRNLTELHIGAPVVHVQHGVGRYLGLQTLEIDGAAHEFLTLGYADDAKLYVPVASLHLIGRYAGADEALAPLHRLGSDQWDKAKRRAAEKAVDAAAELLDIYARRAARLSRQFPAPDTEYDRFVSQFQFELTPDQAQAIDAVLDDLTAEQATDRLICGDVGFGKTEVAMRAAFLAVQAGAQVAVLVPTTLLAEQHGETFRDRFANWPVRIEVLSRLRTDKDAKAVAAGLAAGRVDIVIGTHKLLGRDFAFKDLGLVVVDEEHRFGVRQKERLKALRAEVDILTLTATPIPRTLNMAMSGMRDLSIIATPPEKRLAVKTFVSERRNATIKEAIDRELMRGGQVFYVQNEIRTIEETARQLQELVPDARIGVGHGQMPARELEQVMQDFYHRRLNVLVCTTIIETGIDIPNANTILIERADKLGLAQLHQLRGRVGRSARQAYAYLMTPHPKAISTDARKRLDAIEAAGELGIGFTLATHDMEIRGAGELLGDEQSGQIESVGFSLYMDMLERAVNALKSGQTPDLDTPLEPVSEEVNLHSATLIPEDYLPDVHTRLILYKRISSAPDQQALEALAVEMIDRFGLLPEPLQRLMRVTELKLAASQLGIVRIDLGEASGRFEFDERTEVDPFAIVQLVQSAPSTYRMDGATQLRIRAALPSFEQRAEFATKLLERLRPNDDAKAATS